MKRSLTQSWGRGLLAVLLLLSMTMFFACSSGPEQAQPAQPAQQQDAPADPAAQEAVPEEGAEAAAASDARFQLTGFTAKDLQNNDVTEAVFAGHKVTMVNIWGTFCGPCLREMPDLGELSQEYADKGLQIIGIVADVEEGAGDVDSVRTIVDQTKANYTHLLVSPTLNSKLLGDVMYVPTTYFFDADGYQLGDVVVGSMTKAEWQALFDDMLQSAAE